MNESHQSQPEASATMMSPLQRVTTELEQENAKKGWDQPPALYALVPTKDLLQLEDLAPGARTDLQETWDGSDSHLAAVLQAALQEDNVEEFLPRIVWPDSVSGAALSVERIIVPPEVENEAPEDPDEALEYISNHPARTDVRLTIAVNREGESWCLIRTKTFDDDTTVASGDQLVPSLVEALKVGFIPDQPQQ